MAMELCCTQCGAIADVAAARCGTCDGHLAVRYDQRLRKSRIEAHDTLFGKYPDHLPSNGSLAGAEGNTPLIRATELAEAVGTGARVLIKDERRNPTNSFKDRAFAPVLSFVVEHDIPAVVTASTGNAAAASAHYAARGGVDCKLLVGSHVPREKLTEPLLYGAQVVRVDDLFDQPEASFDRFLLETADRLDGFLALAHRPLTPLAMEGVKTISYEVAEQLDWDAPDVVVTPVGGGDNLAAQHKGYVELQASGLIDRPPRMIGVQASGAAPLARAVEDGLDETPYVDPETVASGIKAAFTGRHAIEAIRESGGTAVAVSDDRIVAGERTLAEMTGIWAEPAAAAVVPALEALVADEQVTDADTVVLTVTGSGHKDPAPIYGTLPSLAEVPFDIDAVVTAFSD